MGRSVKEEMKVSACPEKMHRLGTNGESKSKGNLLSQVYPEQGHEDGVYVCVAKSFNILTT